MKPRVYVGTYAKYNRGSIAGGPSGFGHYKVTYTSPVTGKKWTTVTNKMYLTDKVLHQDFPLIKDMEELKRECKKNN